MATEKQHHEQVEATAAFRRVYLTALYTGGGGLLAAMILGYFMEPASEPASKLPNTYHRFFYSYLISFAFFLSISLGGIFFVLIQHVTRAGWSVGVRRMAEMLAAAMPMVAALSAPIVLSVVLRNGDLYSWSAQGHGGDHEVHLGPFKHVWYHPIFFLLRLALYFAAWSLIAVWYYRQSVRQDSTREMALSERMQQFAPGALVLYALTVTFASFDLLMSLDPHWFSTVFGIYYFSGSAIAIFSTLILVLVTLQSRGYLTATITTEHFHDLGKLLFAFTFFWGYIAFSQFMLLWYANLPEETNWYVLRGASTAQPNAYSPIAILLLVGHLLIPFAGLLSRHVKRRRTILAFWAGWMLVFHWLDLYWLVMPQLDGKLHLGLIDLLCFVGIGGIYMATVMRIAMQNHLRPISDPRLQESVVFENI